MTALVVPITYAILKRKLGIAKDEWGIPDDATVDDMRDVLRVVEADGRKCDQLRAMIVAAVLMGMMRAP